MNSIVSDDISREHLASEAARCLSDIFANNKKIVDLHKELLEANLSITAYVEESKRRLDSLRLDLANNAGSTQKVIDILSSK